MDDVSPADGPTGMNPAVSTAVVVDPSCGVVGRADGSVPCANVTSQQGAPAPRPWRLSWRVLGRKLDGSSFLFQGLEEATSPDLVRTAARVAAAEAYGGEFRVGSPDGAVVYTDLACLLGWDEAAKSLPVAASNSIWRAEVARTTDVEAMAGSLRSLLEDAARRDLLSGAAAAQLVRDALAAAAVARGPGRTSPFAPGPMMTGRV